MTGKSLLGSPARLVGHVYLYLYLSAEQGAWGEGGEHSSFVGELQHPAIGPCCLLWLRDAD